MSPRKKATTETDVASATAEEPQGDTAQQQETPASDNGTAGKQEQDSTREGDDGAALPPAEATTADLKARIESLEDQVLRAKADYQNLQRRSATEQSEAVRYANASLMRSLLGVVDDLERSLAAAEQADDASTLRDGVRLAHENFMKALGDHGLEPIDALNQTFDPAVHNALMQRASADCLPGMVLEEVAKGYRLRDRVLRAAMVIVSKESDEEASDDEPPVDD